MKNVFVIILCIIILILVCTINYKITIETYENSNIIHVHNNCHLGDNIFNIRLFTFISEELKNKNITIRYALESSQIPIVKEWIHNTNQIELIPLENKSSQSYDMWMKHSDDELQKKGIKSFDVFDNVVFHMYNQFMIEHNLSTPINNMYIPDNSLLENYTNLGNKYKNIEILIINGDCRSDQCDNEKNKKEWVDVCHYLNSKYKIATTDKIDGILCTRDDNLSLKDIASISTHVRYIIGVHSGPMTGCYNAYTKQSVKTWFIIRIPNISHSEINNIPMSSPNEVLQYL